MVRECRFVFLLEAIFEIWEQILVCSRMFVFNSHLFNKLIIPDILQDDIAKSQNSSRRFFKLISDGPLDRKGNKSSYILAHNEIGEQLWLRTVERSGKYQVLSLPPNGTSIVKLPDTYSSKDSIDRELVRGLSGKFVAIRISDAEVKIPVALIP